MTAPPPFERAAELRDDLDFLESRLGDPGSVLVPVWQQQTIIERGAEPRLYLPAVEEAAALLDSGGEIAFLGLLGDRACFAVDTSAGRQPSSAGLECVDLRFVGGHLPSWEAQLAAYARGLLYWHAHHGHCPRCGHGTRPRSGGHMRLCSNEGCAAEHFPRTDPAIIVLVQRDGRCLLGRQKSWPAGMYSTLAGFVETGESVEEAVAREVREEAGVQVVDVRYYRSQPWPFPASLMLGYTARAVGEDTPAVDDELEDVRWFSRDQLRQPEQTGIPNFFVSPPYSLAGQLIDEFLNRDA